MSFVYRIFIIFILIARINTQTINGYEEQNNDTTPSILNVSLSTNLSTILSNITYNYSSSSPILKTLSQPRGSQIENNDSRSSSLFTSLSTDFAFASTTIANQHVKVTPVSYVLVNYLVEQFNYYRNVDILSHIKQCDPNMKLNEMCEAYTFDNLTYSLIRDSSVGFQSLENIFDALVDRVVVERLRTLCSIGDWCLGNLTTYNIRFTVDVFRQLGYSFCSLERCHHRLQVHAHECSSISTTNISKPTLGIMPMLCTLYKKQDNWISTECAEHTVYLLHNLYAFWPQIETCAHAISAGSDHGCENTCLALDDVLHKFQSLCDKNDSFLTKISTLTWHRLIDLKQACRHEVNTTGTPFILSVENFISSNVLWYQLHQRPVHAVLFIMGIICVVISFSLCLCFMSSHDDDSTTRHLDDNYEYTRLHDSTFELGMNNEISNTNSTSNRMDNENHNGRNTNQCTSEHQRLLYLG